MKTWMRWGTYAIGMGLALVPMTGRAEEAQVSESAPEARRTLVLAQPLAVLAGQVKVGVEHAVGSHVTLAGDVSAMVQSYGTDYDAPAGGLGAASFSYRSWGVGAAPGVHFYLTGHAPEGFWVGPHLELGLQHQYSRNRTIILPQPDFVTLEGGSRMVTYGGSLRLGYTAILSPGLTVQVGASLVVQNTRTTPFSSKIVEGPGVGGLLDQGIENQNWSVAPHMTVGVGWAF